MTKSPPHNRAGAGLGQCATPQGIALSLASVAIGFGSVFVIAFASLGDRANLFMSSFAAAVFTATGFSETGVTAVPLLLATVGFIIARKVGFWNIGGEGQILLGAVAALVATRISPTMPSASTVILCGAAAFVLPGVVCALTAFMKERRGVDEVLVTLLTNFVVTYLVAYLVAGPLQDPETRWIQSASLPDDLRFSRIEGLGRLSTASAISLAAWGVFSLLERFTVLDVKMRLQGGSAPLEGQSRSRLCLALLAGFSSGGLMGLAGWVELAGTQYRLVQDLSPGYGYSALLVGVLCRSRIVISLALVALLAALLYGIDTATRRAQLPVYVSQVFVGVTLIAYLVGQRLLRLRHRPSAVGA